MINIQCISSVIIDDEKNNCEYLKNLLCQYFPNIDITGEAYDAVSGIQIINKIKPNLVFLDIQMPGANGFDLLEAIPERSFEVIFITAYDQYAIKAIRYCALDYLLKPINVIELQQAISRIVIKFEKKTSQLQEQWTQLQNNTANKEKKIALPTSERILFVKTSEIIRCQGESNYTTVILKNGEKIIVSRTLKDFEELLAEDGFLRVHQSHVINKKMVKSYERKDGGYLKMSDDSQVSISRMRKEMVLKELIK